MRMAGEGDSAADLVNSLDEADLADLLFAYGEERKSRRIAHSIVAARAARPIATTTELARLIEKAVGRKPGDAHPATRSFQALRIAVNDEFGQLVEGLFASERLLAEGGRLAVVTFHSLEDRIVKRFLDPDKGAPAQSRHLPQAEAEVRRWVDIAKAVKPTEAETTHNPRARSAILRSARRSVAPARPVTFAGLGVPRFRGAA
jgi:16S rRNA (cytosine1402-N4)-methyltransferase